MPKTEQAPRGARRHSLWFSACWRNQLPWPTPGLVAQSQRNVFANWGVLSALAPMSMSVGRLPDEERPEGGQSAFERFNATKITQTLASPLVCLLPWLRAALCSRAVSCSPVIDTGLSRAWQLLGRLVVYPRCFGPREVRFNGGHCAR